MGQGLVNADVGEIGRHLVRHARDLEAATQIDDGDVGQRGASDIVTGEIFREAGDLALRRQPEIEAALASLRGELGVSKSLWRDACLAMGREEAAIAYVGLGAWLGESMSQNKLGHILGHVKDLGLPVPDDAGHDQVGIVEGCAIGVGQRVA